MKSGKTRLPNGLVTRVKRDLQVENVSIYNGPLAPAFVNVIVSPGLSLNFNSYIALYNFLSPKEARHTKAA